jgi:hypothetical protein
VVLVSDQRAIGWAGRGYGRVVIVLKPHEGGYPDPAPASGSVARLARAVLISSANGVTCKFS